jgi:phosphate transport system protein
MNDKHLSTQIDAELGSISTRVLEMGGLVEDQLEQAVLALTEASRERAAAVLEQEDRVNHMEVEIDGELSAIIALRQPAARDLRLLIAISKAIANLERAGDEAARIARVALRLMAVGIPSRLPLADLQHEAALAAALLRQSLDALARLDASKAWAGFLHAKPGEKGKKENAKEEAERIAGKSKYTPGAKPRLVASN